MTDTTARIRAKGLDALGVTEDIANQLYARKGAHQMFIGEYRVDETHERADGTKKVDLVLTQVEPATDEQLAEHLRELTRVGYMNRQQANGQLAIDQSLDDEPTVEQVMAAGQQHRPHPFLPVDATQDNPICDVCGRLETAPVHSAQEVLDDPDAEEDPEDDGDQDDDAVDEDEDEDEPVEDPWPDEEPDRVGGRPVSTISDPFTA